MSQRNLNHIDILRARIRKTLSNVFYLGRVGKPRVFFRYLRKYLRARFLGIITPRQVDIALTFECNMACDHCFTAPLLNRNEREMDLGTLKRMAKDCKKLDITVIHLTGGEILMRQDLEQVIALFNPKENLVYMQSNGTLATYDRLVSLKKAGLDFFGVSLECPDPKDQDRFRHYPGYFEKALAAVDLAQKAGLQTSVNLTIDNRLIHSPELPRLIADLGQKGHIVYGNLPVPVGRFRDQRNLLWMDNERKTLDALTNRFPHFRTEFDSNFGPYGCPAMKEKIYVSAYGDVLACPYIHVSFGNVGEESLTDIYRRGLRFPVFNRYHDHCLAAEDRTFIRRIIDKTLDFSRQPVLYKALEQDLTATCFHGKSMTGRNNHLDLELDHVPCPVCDADSPEHVIEAPDFETPYANRFNVVRCGDCGMMYTSPRPSMEDLFRYFYADHYVCYTRSGLADAIRETYLCRTRYKALKDLIPENGRFLDVGCAYGYFLDYLQKNTRWEAHGCEPNREMAQKARHNGLSVRATTLAQAGYPDNYFDLVYMSHVLEHVPDLRETIREVFRILKPGGLFITENPDADAPTRKPLGEAWWGYHLPRHLSHFNAETIGRLLKSYGFDVEKTIPCFRPGPIAWSIQNRMKAKGHPDLICSLFGVQNPLFVAACGIPGLAYLRRGHTDMMETRARKPQGALP
jgi:MoaA/NifB/PqqE/SkfB family radical SAM enzyme/SAM-dependent methyltransferase